MTFQSSRSNRAVNKRNTNSKFRQYFALTLVGVSVGLAGCSGKQSLIEEKDFLIEEQRAKLESCENQLVAKDKEIAKLKQDKEGTDAELAQCRKDVAKAAQTEKDLADREAQLRETLADDIEKKNIEIERLKDRLSVRVVDRVLFRSGSVEILPEGQGVLTRIAGSLADSQETIRIEGHTDNVPIGVRLVERIPTNWELSVLRASSVVRFLEQQNIVSERMSAVGHSKYKPVAENDSAENRQLNRRVEIVLLP
ncbi:MAG: OmpA family protein [Pseudomonadales bacterium]